MHRAADALPELRPHRSMHQLTSKCRRSSRRCCLTSVRVQPHHLQHSASDHSRTTSLPQTSADETNTHPLTHPFSIVSTQFPFIRSNHFSDASTAQQLSFALIRFALQSQFLALWLRCRANKNCKGKLCCAAEKMQEGKCAIDLSLLH